MRSRRWAQRSRIVQKSQLLAPSTPNGPGPMPTISDSDLMGDITMDPLNTTPIGLVSSSEKITACSATDHSDSPGESEALACQPAGGCVRLDGAAHLLAHLIDRP